MPEQWKVIENACNYQVSNEGRVRRPDGQLVAPNRNDRSHYYVDLPHQPPRSIHTLVYEAFVGPLVKGLYVKHRDGNRFNNHVENLQQMTPRESVQHNIALGIHNNKLNESIARQIKRDLRLGRPRKDIIKSYPKVTYNDIDNIIRGRAWAYVEG